MANTNDDKNNYVVPLNEDQENRDSNDVEYYTADFNRNAEKNLDDDILPRAHEETGGEDLDEMADNIGADNSNGPLEVVDLNSQTTVEEDDNDTDPLGEIVDEDSDNPAAGTPGNRGGDDSDKGDVAE